MAINAREIINETLANVEATDSEMNEAKKLIDFMRKTGFPGVAELEADFNKVKVQRDRFIAEAKNA